MKIHFRRNKGFTLIELLVVIAIISLLSSVVLASLNSARAKARDSKRKQDMVQIRTALELYFSTNGSYPLAYAGYWGGVNASPGCGTNGTTSGATAYITGLTPAYIPVLPTDPRDTVNSCSGYIYQSDGANYKFLVYQTFEGANPTTGQPFDDPLRPTNSIMICSGEPACGTW